MAEDSPHRHSGCGLLNAVFRRRRHWPRRTTSTGSLPPMNGNNIVKSPSTPTSRRWQSSEDAGFIEPSSNDSSPVPSKPTSKAATPYSSRNPPVYNQNQARNNGQQAYVNQGSRQAYVNQGKKVPKAALGLSGELESMIEDKYKGRDNLVRASSGNVMLYGNLGNLRQGGAGKSNVNYYTSNEKYPNAVMGNVVKSNNEEKKASNSTASSGGSLCRALSTRMDPETLKIMGNEDYKNGNFAEALALYDAAISIDPNKASYRSNKSAALTALGRLLDAVFECKEAIRIEPRYHRAHQRLATLYLRLGDAEKVSYHHKLAGPEADQEDLAKAKNIQLCLSKCTEARRLRKWNAIVKETEIAISAGADSAPQIYALQAEALLKMRRHQEAEEVLARGPKFDDDALTKFYGPIGMANLLVVRAQVDMTIGRFNDALAAAQQAARLDSNNREVNIVLKKARAVGAARLKGNELFKASRFSEACIAYGEGLEHDPYNSVLLCNRAASRNKLGQFDKAVEDCTTALNLRPSYSKARLRRADCNARMQNWTAAIKDYEILLKETPDDEGVKEALSEAQAQLKKQQQA